MKSFTLDAKKTLKGKFKPSQAAERDFYRQLKKVARASGHIVERHIPTIGHPYDLKRMQAELDKYSEALGPWAERQSAKMLEQVQKSNKRAYVQKSKAIGTLLKADMDRLPPQVLYRLLHEQVALIKSIPIEAGMRAQKIAYEAVLAGTRAEVNTDTVAQLEKELGLSTEVATSRALLIARTEVARSNAAINQSRAMGVGSRQYRWHNSGDGNVREAHLYWRGREKLQGKIFSWDSPPTLMDGTKGHPGTFPNCRCFAEPVFDEE